MTYLSLEDRMMEYGQSIEKQRETIISKIFTKDNLKYLGAEVPGFILGNILGVAVYISLYKAGVSPLLIAPLTALADSIGFYVGNAGTFSFENIKQYREGKRNWKEDMKKLAISNTESAILGMITKTVCIYFTNRYDIFNYKSRAVLSTSIASILPSAVRHLQNYKNGLVKFNRTKTYKKINSSLPF